ncbi:lysine N(6)-hydroxylase/L-ornithine N(5)-oxygenase family protein [Thalassococcus sp. S3]|uniref:lysine N(6)-hydroxylase/L-ornithine N(5)-oxygenase family protein n=1 Tax=Thalassococcus sp. S3 TaxID=2017482 RepID=UPI0010245163|nr:SidA/IucD/PvdA family monooxygenase [Thalassococcus sp. S3]QBF33466.1 lysine 6-monooxygenase [Thalassococcus sp. S3]
MTSEFSFTDLAGIGIGPFNLSLAALANDVPQLKTRFFDQKPAFSWHPGLAFDDSVMQTSYLKDMVTPVRPTSALSFLNYLVLRGRFYDFMAARFETVSRREFTDYMAWVAHQLEICEFGAQVREVDHDGQRFLLRMASGDVVQARGLSVGTGPVPNVPEGAPLGPNCFHGIEYLERGKEIAGKRVAVIGGGQTGAEIVLDLLTARDGPAQLTWLSRRSAFWQLQEGGLVDQIFTPAYHNVFLDLPGDHKKEVVADQKYSSDGLTPATADEIYRQLYRHRHLEGGDAVSLRPGRTVTRIDRRFGGFQLQAETPDGGCEGLNAEVVILATGFRPTVPGCLDPIRDRLTTEAGGALALDARYRVLWDGPEDTPIYGMNHGRQSHGIVDPQLSLTAWRSASILEDFTGRPLFDALRTGSDGLVDWAGGQMAEESVRIPA